MGPPAKLSAVWSVERASSPLCDLNALAKSSRGLLCGTADLWYRALSLRLLHASTKALKGSAALERRAVAARAPRRISYTTPQLNVIA
jgi:hypothetical protein